MARDDDQGSAMHDEIAERMNSATVWAMPASWYWDPEIYAKERRYIFSRHWLCIGREETVTQPGQYLTATV